MTTVPKVAILGGGISGITTGIVLQLHGYRTKVYTHRRIDEVHPNDATRRPPELASIHAAASVLPHSANAPGIQELTRLSQLAFHRLAFCGHFGVRMQRHYELFEQPKEFPNYAREVKDFTPLKDNGSSWIDDRSIPMRKGAKGVWGWYFNAFFTEVPIYISSLYNLYNASGGEIEVLDTMIDVKAFAKQTETWKPDALVICAGYGSPWVLGRSQLEEVPVTRGHMVKVHIYDVPHDHADRYFSYNYSPVAVQAYTDTDGETADVYFYPRSDGWLLGGSRQRGLVDLKTGIWRPATYDTEKKISTPTGETREEFEKKRPYFKRKEDWSEKIPQRIWDLNQELVLDITDVDINRYPSSSYIGYRFLTDPIEMGHDQPASESIKRPVYNNFGHGGSGYTLSWGCAWNLLAEMEKQGLPSTIKPYRDVTQIKPSRRMAQAVLTSLEDLARHQKAVRDRPSFE